MTIDNSLSSQQAARLSLQLAHQFDQLVRGNFYGGFRPSTIAAIGREADALGPQCKGQPLAFPADSPYSAPVLREDRARTDSLTRLPLFLLCARAFVPGDVYFVLHFLVVLDLNRPGPIDAASLVLAIDTGADAARAWNLFTALKVLTLGYREGRQRTRNLVRPYSQKDCRNGGLEASRLLAAMSSYGASLTASPGYVDSVTCTNWLSHEGRNFTVTLHTT